MAKKKAKKKAPKTPTWQDSTYQKQISYYKKLASDYGAEETRRRSDTGTYYGTLGTPDRKINTGKTRTVTKNVKTPVRKTKFTPKKGTKIGSVQNSTYYKYVKKKVKEPIYKTQKGNAATEGLYQSELRSGRKKDLTDIADDYAARGIIHSGLYAQKRGDYEGEFGKQLSELSRQKGKQYGDISSERRQFDREQELQKENARLDAIRRRAAKSGNFGV